MLQYQNHNLIIVPKKEIANFVVSFFGVVAPKGFIQKTSLNGGVFCLAKHRE